MPGHLFVVRGDITKLACDAWLATGDWNGPGSRWVHQKAVGEFPEDPKEVGGFGGGDATNHPANPPGSGEESQITLSPSGPSNPNVVRWQRYGTPVGRSPQPWYVDVTREPVEHALAFLQEALAFIEAEREAERASNSGDSPWRAKPLLALPLPGAGRAGHRQRAGAVLAKLIPAINKWLERKEVDADVALVLWTDPHYFAAQHIRAQLNPAWSELESQRDRLEFLASKAVSGQLVLFLGAGVSMGAGLPSWEKFLTELGKKLGVEKSTMEEIEGLSIMDRPHALEAIFHKQSREPGSFKELIKSTIQGYGERCALSHCMLSSLPVVEAVTTNYDQLFEIACDGAKRARYRIPWERPQDKRRWLLKMHGCVTRPASIVLSRRDYSLYDAEHGVLASIVQAMLVTRHMLFVGFGMEDPNFRSIFDTVKNAVEQRDRRILDTEETFGTALFLECSKAFRDIWEGDVHVLEFPGAEGADRSALARARRVEIALDFLAAQCCQDDDVPLLDTTLFQSTVVPDDDLQRLNEIATDLAALHKKCQVIKTSSIQERLAKKVQQLLKELGVE